jgi:hypothetical protein
MAETSRFNPPFSRTARLWAICGAIVAIALAYWAASVSETQQLATNEPTVSEPLLQPPITQPPPAEPARPASPGL